MKVTYFGLTGGIACGKSTVAGMLEALGARIIDADRIGHELLLSPKPAYTEVVNRFGREILAPSGEIDRKKLGAIVFADSVALAALNGIVHPRIIQRTEELAASYRDQDLRSVVVVDAALIFEAGIGGRFKRVIVAWCLPEQQLERLMAKSDLTRQEAEQRIAAQMPSEEKRRRADYVIDCSGTLEETRRQAVSVHAELERLAA